MNNPTIYSYSIVFSSFGEFVSQVPYVAALLENEDQSRFPALILGDAAYFSGIRIGQVVYPTGTNEKGEAIFSLIESPGE